MELRAIERCASALAGAGILAAAVFGSGCAQILGIEELSQSEPVDAAPEDTLPLVPVDAAIDAAETDTGPGSGDYAVRGSASGLLGSVALELRLDSDTELLAVMEDGSFAFNTQLRDGTPYTVVLVDQNAPCALRNQTGMIMKGDAAIELTCTGASLTSVVVSGIAPVVALVSGTTEYLVDLPLSQSSVTVRATVATPGDTLTIAGTSVASGAPSASITLSLGDNPVDISVESNLGWQRTYRLTLRRATQLAQYAYGKASNTGAGDQFGNRVALSGDTLAVGAHLEDSAPTGADDSVTNSGAVYVFRRTGTVWRQDAYLKASNTDSSDDFGVSVALSGDTLAVGAPLEDSAAIGVNGNQTSNSVLQSGAVYVFRRTDTWQQEAYVKASNTGANDRFGTSVALSGDILAVGAHFEDSAATGVPVNGQSDNSAPSSGAVYVFRRSGITWQQEAYVKASNTGADDTFGASLALSGDTLAVGAPLEDSAATGVPVNGQSDNSAPSSGAVYVFRHSGIAWQQEAYMKASNTDPEDRFGTSVALSGDTLAVGAPLEDSASTGVGSSPSNNAALDSGAVYVFRRSGTTWQQEVYIKPTVTGPDDQFGTSVALSGDTLAVGAPLEDSAATGVGGSQTDNSFLQSGAAYMFGRAGTTWQQTAYLKASNTDVDDSFGTSVAVSGDTVAVGAYFEDSAGDSQSDNTALESGAVYIFH